MICRWHASCLLIIYLRLSDVRPQLIPSNNIHGRDVSKIFAWPFILLKRASNVAKDGLNTHSRRRK